MLIGGGSNIKLVEVNTLGYKERLLRSFVYVSFIPEILQGILIVLVVFIETKKASAAVGLEMLFHLHENAVIKKSIDCSTQFTLMDIPNWGNKPQFHILSLNVLLSYAITQLYNF